MFNLVSVFVLVSGLWIIQFDVRIIDIGSGNLETQFLMVVFIEKWRN